MKPIQRILVATDFSAGAEAAAQAAARLARQTNAAIDLITVVDTSPLVEAYGDAAYRTQRISEIHLGAHESAERFAAQHMSPNAPVRVHVRDGATPEQILQAAEELGSDLIVMGTHGRTGLAHLLLGSVAEKVVRKSSIPVLTVRIPAAGATARDASRIDPRIFWW